MKGTVKWFDNKKGYGFLTPDEEGAKDVFVHHTTIDGEGFKTLDQGQAVEFEIEETAKGSQARGVKKV